MGRAGRIGITILFLLGAQLLLAENSASPFASINDNRTSAGQFTNGILNLHLELSRAQWYPESDTGVRKDVYAFAEEGRVPQIPGPLLRVPQGTVIHASLHNSLPEAAKVYGLHRHPGNAKDAIALAPGESREVQSRRASRERISIGRPPRTDLSTIEPVRRLSFPAHSSSIRRELCRTTISSS